MKKYNKILITGAAGQLGGELVRQMRQAGYDVLGIDLIDSPTTDCILNIEEAAAVEAVSKGCDAILHTAALHGKHYELKYPRLAFVETNIKGTLNLLNACCANGISKFVYTSTTSIYGHAMVNATAAVWVDEQLQPIPRDVYDITKMAAEQLCHDFWEKEGLETTVLRVSRFLPETDYLKAIHRLYRGLDERDGAQAHILALETPLKSFEIFNISNDTPFQPSDLTALRQNPAAVIQHYYPQAAAYFEAQNWAFPQGIDRVYVIEKAKKWLNYRPIHNFDTLIQ